MKNKLKKQSTATGDGVARAFLRAQAALFGSYRDALRYKPVSSLLVQFKYSVSLAVKATNIVCKKEDLTLPPHL